MNTIFDRNFGRIVKFDERSRNFPIRALMPVNTKPRSYTWRCNINLDQGTEGACTGFSVTHEAAARPVEVKGLNESVALKIYNRAKQLDAWPGEDYDGSSVLAAIKAGKEMNWYSEYRWAFNMDDLTWAIGHRGPAVLGINWYEGMCSTDESGIIHPTGRLLGGHAILANGYNKKKNLIRLHNSWGKSWGVNGYCFISVNDLDRILHENGEACIPVKRQKGLLN